MADRSDQARQWHRLYDAEWRRYRRQYLLEHRTCMDPFGEHGLLVIASVVDHVIPHRGDRELFWDSANHQALCRLCHDRKTAAEDGGFGNR